METPLNCLPPEMQSAVTAELQPGESPIWAAEPTAREQRRQSGGLVFVGFCFTAFAAFWVIATAREAMNYRLPRHGGIPWDLLGFLMGGLPFLGIGIVMLTTPLWRGRRAIRIAYVLTDRRAIVFNGEMLSRQINARSYTPEQMKQLHAVDRAGGGGDVVFDRVMVPSGKIAVPTQIGFFGIADPHRVAALIRDRFFRVPSPGTPVRG